MRAASPAFLSQGVPIDARSHWRKTLTLTLGLLGLWAAAGLGCGVLLADALNGVEVLGSIPLGFWFAQQGSIVVFVAIVFAYALAMNRLDARWRRSNPPGAGATPPPPRPADAPPGVDGGHAPGAAGPPTGGAGPPTGGAGSPTGGVGSPTGGAA